LQEESFGAVHPVPNTRTSCIICLLEGDSLPRLRHKYVFGLLIPHPTTLPLMPIKMEDVALIALTACQTIGSTGIIDGTSQLMRII
jgi:hypothetical protein